MRKATAIELTEIHSIYQQSFKETLEKYNDGQTNPAGESLERLQEKFYRSANYFYFILLENEIVGTIRLVVEGSIAKIGPLAVLPAFQKQGFGTAALLLVEKEQPQVTRWLLDTIKQETHLVRLYQKQGYVLTGASQKLKEGMDILFFEKEVGTC